MLNPDSYHSGGGWSSRRPLIAGICADLAAEFDLPIGIVRAVMLIFSVLPTGLTYLTLALLSGQRNDRAGWLAGVSGTRPRTLPASPLARDLGTLRQRFSAIDRRLSDLEAFVSSKDFELHKGFRSMGG